MEKLFQEVVLVVVLVVLVVEAVLVHCNLVNQQASKVLFTFDQTNNLDN